MLRREVLVNRQLVLEWQREEAAADVEYTLDVRFRDSVVADIKETDVLTGVANRCRGSSFGPRREAQHVSEVNDGYFIEGGSTDGRKVADGGHHGGLLQLARSETPTILGSYIGVRSHVPRPVPSYN